MASGMRQALQEVRIDLDGLGDGEAKQLIAVKDDHLFIWAQKKTELLSVSVKREWPEAESRVQTIELTDPPSFQVTHVIASQEGNYLCLQGRRGITCVELPLRAGRLGRLGGDELHTTCRSFSVAEKIIIYSSRMVVQQVLFHPGSISHSHLVVLTSDNQLRIFDLEISPAMPQQTIPLCEKATERANFFGKGPLSVKGSLGEAAVGLTFAPPVEECDSEESINSKLWPIFVLNGDGEVFCLLTSLRRRMAEEGFVNKILGPLAMYPESPDNYGTDFSSILCLAASASSPQVLVLASTSGILYHCVLVNQKDEGYDKGDVSHVPNWSRAGVAQLGLLVYEAVQLDIGLRAERSINRLVDYPVIVYHDQFFPARYFCIHQCGAHSISVPMVSTLAEMNGQTENERTDLIPASLEQESVIEHLICSQVEQTSSYSSPMMGVASTRFSMLACLLSDGKVATLDLRLPFFDLPAPVVASSPLRTKLKSHSSTCAFDEKVRMMLRRTLTVPVLKAAGDKEQLKGKDCLDLVTSSIKILRDEYLLPQANVSSEIRQRQDLLAKTLALHNESLTLLISKKDAMRDKAATISEKYEELKDQDEQLRGRIETVLQKVQSLLPEPSDADIRMQKQVRQIQKRVKDMTDRLEHIKYKQRYQLDKMEQRDKATDLLYRRGTLGENQLRSIRDVLEQDKKEIAEMAKCVNNAKKEAQAL